MNEIIHIKAAEATDKEFSSIYARTAIDKRWKMEQSKVKLTITASACRCGYHRKGDEFLVEDICPPLCHELWNSIYPSVYTLLNGGVLDYGNGKSRCFDAKCPDGGRVCIHGEAAGDKAE